MDYSTSAADAGFVADLERRFTKGIAARAEAADATGVLPEENWRDVVDSGYLRAFHPVGAGGLGLDGVTQAMAMEAICFVIIGLSFTIMRTRPGA